MASTFTRPDSPFVWLRFKEKDAAGVWKWRSRKTGYRKDNFGDRRQAEELAKDVSRDARIAAASEEVDRAEASEDSGGADGLGGTEGAVDGARAGGAGRSGGAGGGSGRSGRSDHWDDWVDKWLVDTYGAAKTQTLTVYQRYWRRFRPWLLAEKVTGPRQVTFNLALRYKLMRERNETGVNTIIHELKFLGVVMNEAIRRGFAAHNPCQKMGLKRAPQKGKDPWTVAQVAAVAERIHEQPDWMQATFILGLYQAARLRQCEVPLADIDLERRRITYWRTVAGRPLVKGNKPFTQPLAEAALPLLGDLMARRRAGGYESLCDIPACPSLEWRVFLDSLGFANISHHGLRATWITRAALNRDRVSREEAMRFVNHGSTSVHALYQRLNADDVSRVADALGLPVFQPVKAPSPSS
jgi:integrase